MSKHKESIVITGVIRTKYEIMKLANDLEKQRFFVLSDQNERFFLTAFGKVGIEMLSNLSINEKAHFNCTKEISVKNNKQYINYYLNSISEIANHSSDTAHSEFNKYIVFLNVNKIPHNLKPTDFQNVFSRLQLQHSMNMHTFTEVFKFTVEKWHSYIHFNLKDAKILERYFNSALELMMEKPNP